VNTYEPAMLDEERQAFEASAAALRKAEGRILPAG